MNYNCNKKGKSLFSEKKKKKKKKSLNNLKKAYQKSKLLNKVNNFARNDKDFGLSPLPM